MSEPQRFPRPFHVLSYAVFTTGLLAFVGSWQEFPLQSSLSLVLLAVGAVLSENYELHLEGCNISLTYPLTVAAIVLSGPTASAVVAGLSAITLMDLRKRTPPIAMLFNLGELLLVTLSASWAYLAMGGRVLQSGGFTSAQPFSATDFPGILIPLVAVALICTLGNLAIVALGLTAISNQSLRSSLAGLAWLIPSQLALAFVGYLIAQVLAINPIALPIFVAPLLVARQLYQRYAALEDAYTDTVRSLVGALEAKDPYTRGHSERVATYSLKLGALVGLDSRALKRLEYAALLHDLGKLAVPGTLLTKPGALTDAEMESVRLHAPRGAEMVAKIPRLRDLSDYIGNHHEWYDGGGYPLKARAPAIPQLALIMGVADSYDAMTTTRAYRPALSHDEAVAELIRGAGSQFDPNLVRSFIEGRVGSPEIHGDEAEEALGVAVCTAAQEGGA